jgi:4a-hydroxytetrahydrobiopterin dehydratase
VEIWPANGKKAGARGMEADMATLTPEQLATELATTPGWTISDGQLIRAVTRQDFRDALLFVNAVGFLAERANHHPDIAIAWNAVTLTLVTHSAGGLTEMDFQLARQISDLG